MPKPIEHTENLKIYFEEILQEDKKTYKYNTNAFFSSRKIPYISDLKLSLGEGDFIGFTLAVKKWY